MGEEEDVRQAGAKGARNAEGARKAHGRRADGGFGAAAGGAADSAGSAAKQGSKAAAGSGSSLLAEQHGGWRLSQRGAAAAASGRRAGRAHQASGLLQLQQVGQGAFQIATLGEGLLLGNRRGVAHGRALGLVDRDRLSTLGLGIRHDERLGATAEASTRQYSSKTSASGRADGAHESRRSEAARGGSTERAGAVVCKSRHDGLGTAPEEGDTRGTP